MIDWFDFDSMKISVLTCRDVAVVVVVAAVVAVVVVIDLEQDKALWVLIGRKFSMFRKEAEKSNLFILSEKKNLRLVSTKIN